MRQFIKNIVARIRRPRKNPTFRIKDDMCWFDWFIFNDDTDCTFSVSEKVTNQQVLTFESPASQPDKITPMVRELFGIKGVETVKLAPYTLKIEWAKVFKPREIMPQAKAIIIKHLAPVSQTAKL